jgi:crotonobetainyl-CoA:carnitine CoA-transferase CaiB-like acyl-CoA transferase
MDSLGLGYTDLEKINPEVILVSITPFGQTGPYRDWKTSDIVAWALGGYLAPFGEGDRPPIQIGHHSQAYLHAGADGAMGALAALFARGSTGEGQHVDVSIHESVAQCAESLSGVKGVARRLRQQGKETTTGASPDPAHFWPCKDGYVCWSYGNARITPCRPLINWMAFKGMATDFLKEFDWERPDFMDVYQQERQRIDEPTAAFFMAHTKAELLEEAIEHKVMLYPVSTTADMLANLQLSEREFWIELEHPELGVKLTYPGVFANTSNAQLRMTRRAPLIGEHNREIYQDELGILAERLSAWEQNGVI